MSDMHLHMSASELREHAAGCRRQKEESFERCDTDGFLSQWASGITAELYEEQAKIVDRGGVAGFTGLYEGERRVRAKLIKTPVFNAPWASEWKWLLAKDEYALIEARGSRYVPEGEKSRIQKKLGLVERPEMDKAAAKIMGSGKGLSGCASAFVGYVRTGDEWGATATIREG